MQTIQHTKTPRELVLELVAAARNNRELLAEVYRTKPLNYELVGVLKAAIRYDLETATALGSLAVVDKLEELQLALEADVAVVERIERTAHHVEVVSS